VQVVDDAIIERVEYLRLKRLVHYSPIDAFAGDFVTHDEFVFRRTSGMRSGVTDESSSRVQPHFAAAHRAFHQRRSLQIEMHAVAAQQFAQIVDLD